MISQDITTGICGPFKRSEGLRASAEAWFTSPKGEAFFAACEMDIERDRDDPEIELLVLEKILLPEFKSDLQRTLHFRPGATYENDPDVKLQVDEINRYKARAVLLRRGIMRVVSG